MPEIKIVTEVAGRICATPVQVGGTVADGDDVVVENGDTGTLAASGTLKSPLLAIDDLVAAGEAIAIVAS